MHSPHHKTPLTASPRPAKEGRTHKRSAKGTGGYGDVDVQIALRLPAGMKDAIGKLAAAKSRSSEAYIRGIIVKELDNDKKLLCSKGGVPPTKIDLMMKYPRLEKYLLSLSLFT